MIRTVLIPKKQLISFRIPKAYIGKELEILAFEKEEGLFDQKSTLKKVTFESISIDTLNFRFDRTEANER